MEQFKINIIHEMLQIDTTLSRSRCTVLPLFLLYTAFEGIINADTKADLSMLQYSDIHPICNNSNS